MAVSDFFAGWPVWVWVLIIAVLVFIVYLVLGTEEKIMMRGFLRQYGLILVFIAIYFIVKDSWGVWEAESFFEKKANTIFTIFGLMYLAGKLFISKARYDTKSFFLAEGLHGSFSDMPDETENGFLIFPLGGLRSNGIHFQRGNAVAVVRKETGQFIGSSFISIAHMKKIPRERLPDEVRARLDRLGYLKNIDEIYYGWFDSQTEEDWAEEQLKSNDTQQRHREIYKLIKDEFKLRNPTVGDLLQVVETTDARFNKLREHFDEVTTSTEHFDGHMGRRRSLSGGLKPISPPSHGDDVA